MKTPEYQKGYSAGYTARIKAHESTPAEKPKPDWVQAVAELAERLGREHMAKTCRDLADAHMRNLASDSSRYIRSVSEAELLTVMQATLEPIIARIELPNDVMSDAPKATENQPSLRPRDR